MDHYFKGNQIINWNSNLIRITVIDFLMRRIDIAENDDFRVGRFWEEKSGSDLEKFVKTQFESFSLLRKQLNVKRMK